MKKMVKKTSSQQVREKQIYHIIYSLIQEDKNPLAISKRLNWSKQRLNPYVQRMKRAGLIEMIGKGVWKISKKFDIQLVKNSKLIRSKHLVKNPENFFTKYKEDSVRGHAFIFRLKIPWLSNWTNRIKYLIKKDINYKLLRFGNVRIIFKGRKIHLNNKSIVIYERESFMAETSKDSKNHAVYEFLSLIRSLENMLKCSFKLRNKYYFRVCREHYGFIKNRIAKQFDREGKRIACFTSQGKWFEIDNSYNLHEAEVQRDRSHDDNQATDDAEGFQNWMNGMKDTNFKVTPEFILNAINGVSNNQGQFAENMSSHVQAIQELAKGVKKLTKKIEELKKV